MAGTAILKPDLCIVGGGVAGHGLALAATALGLTCVLVDKAPRLGRGQAGDLALDMLIMAGHAVDPRADRDQAFEQLRNRIGAAVGAAAPNFDAARLRAAGHTVLTATGRFVNARTLVAGDTTIRAHRFVLATGARGVAPRIPGLDLVRPVTLEAVTALAHLPPSLAVLGAAPAAYEVAQAFHRLGSRVTLLVPPHRAADTEMQATLLAGLRRGGLEIIEDAAIASLQPSRDGMTIRLDRDGPEGPSVAQVVLADARAPFLEGLGLDRAGIRVVEGKPVVSQGLRTTNPRVFAIGDVLGEGAQGPAAIAVQVGLVLRNAFFRQSAAFDPTAVPGVIRTNPGLAHVGSTEAQASASGQAVRVLRWSFAETDRARAVGQLEGHVKVVATPAGRILSATIVGPQAGELIAPWSLAVARSLPLEAIATLPVAMPSLSDASRRAALAFVAGRLNNPWLTRARKLLQRLG